MNEIRRCSAPTFFSIFVTTYTICNHKNFTYNYYKKDFTYYNCNYNYFTTNDCTYNDFSCKYFNFNDSTYKKIS